MADPVTVGVAVGWGMKAAGWVVSPIISKLLSKGFSYLSFDTSEKLKQLEIKVLQLELMLGWEAAQIYPHRNRLEPLLKNLKSSFYEAEDILDDLEYHRLQRQSLSHPRSRKWMQKIHSDLPSCSFLKNQDGGNMSDEASPSISTNKLKKSLKKIENTINEAHTIISLLNLPDHTYVDKRQIVNANSHSPVTTATPPPVVIGRDKDRDSIVSMLHKNGGDVKQQSNNALSCSIIGIHGIPGSGKSTLAQLICSCEKKDKQDKKTCHFDLIMWIHVSQNFTVDKIFREMFEEATGETCPEFKSLNTLEQKMEEVLSKKRFLLVLDDVWYNKGESQQQLEKLVFPLEVGKAGSKILVTSRTTDALLAVGAGTCIPISDLDDNLFLKLFMHYALEGANIDEPDRSKFERIGTDIAKKLRRSPLAAKTVGGQLRIRPNVEFWTYARNRDLLNDTMGALWWSYQQLDEQVRRCFSYCSIFSRRQQLERDYLVKMWVAQGFIRTTDAGEDLEDVGHRYFDELVSCSFFQKQRRLFGCKDYFTVHDLLHDLAEKVAGSDCFRIRQDWTGDLPRDVSHLTIETYDKTMITERISKLESLRTLIIYMNNTGMVPDKMVFESVFTRMRKLRVLRVQSVKPGREQDNVVLSLPACIGKLKHLRYFGYMSGYTYKLVLPRTITKLYHLQVLEFDSCGDLVFSSDDDLSKLTNLRHVIIFSFSPFSIRHLGRLRSLQAMPQIEVKNEVGYELQQLEHLSKLRGRLHIRGLENVENKEAAVQANLAGKERLKELVLEWDDVNLGYYWDENNNAKVLQAEVLEGLCPPTDLEVLHIKGYQGPWYPIWLVGQQNSMKNLQKLELSRSSPLGCIPEHSELFSHLRSLRISDCNWDYLPDNMVCLTTLNELTLLYCDRIVSLPKLPQSLENFRVVSCNRVLMSSCQTTGHPNWRNIRRIPHKEISMF